MRMFISVLKPSQRKSKSNAKKNKTQVIIDSLLVIIKKASIDNINIIFPKVALLS